MTQPNQAKTWREIRDWAVENDYKHLAARMELNNRCWNSSGEFGRSQVEICDTLRSTKTEKEAKRIAAIMDGQMEKNYGLY